MASATPVLVTPSGVEPLAFSPAGTWPGTNRISRLKLEIRKASVGNWNYPVIRANRYPAGITGNANWSISLKASERAKLLRGVTYQARVRTWNKNNVRSDWSNVTTFTVTADDPTITLNTLTEEADGHTPLEGLVLTGTLGSASGVTPASIKLEVFEAQSGDLKFSQMHAVTTKEAQEGQWAIPYLGPDLRSRLFLPTDKVEVLGTESGTVGIGTSFACTIPTGTTGIIYIGYCDPTPPQGVALGGVALDMAYAQTANDGVKAGWADVQARANDTLTTTEGINRQFSVIYVGGNAVGGDSYSGNTDGYDTVSLEHTRDGDPGGTSIVGGMAAAVHNLLGGNVDLKAYMTDLHTSDIGNYKVHWGYNTDTDDDVTLGATYNIHGAAFGGAWAEAVVYPTASFNGLYDIKVTIQDSVNGSASVTGSDYMHIYRELLDDETTENLTTGLSNIRPTQRILVRDMKANRGPGKVIGIIEDARNIGLSRYASSPGELYFTLQTLHPQISIIEPFATHYEYQQYRRGRWVSLEYGIFVDFDATEDEVVFYGMDYLGLLSVSVEGAHQIAKSPNKSISKNHGVLSGSRYKKKSIRYIIKNQLQRAKHQETHSPVKFINIGSLDSMKTKVTIFASHVERLAFIRGLIESHKGGQVNGQERRTRLRVRRRPAKRDFAFELLDNKGSDKEALRLEFGGLVQGYRIVAYDDYRNKVYGIGVKPNASKPFFLNKVAQGVTLSDWGVWGKAEMHGDIVDRKDLARRARASANRLSRPGKSVALGIRVRSLDYCDGYDVLDSIPVDIVDGAIDTNNFGGGYWTIWGINYRVYDDEHDELTWIIRPKGDSDDFDPDLITSEPEAISSEWAWGSGEPTP